MKAGLICLLTLVNLMSSCINRDKSFDGESFLVGTGACTVIHSDTLTCNCDLKEDTVYMRTLKATYPMGTELVTTMAINSTDIPLEYGCDWWLYKWTVNKWEKAVPQRDISFAGCIVTPSYGNQYYFFVYPVGVFYNLEPGRYRISQPFRCDGKNLELGADFEVG